MSSKYDKSSYVKDVSKDMKRMDELTVARQHVARGYLPVMLSGLFLISIAIVIVSVLGTSNLTIIYTIAAVICGYMALNIGANDVANNVGPAVGSRSITMFGAVALAAVFEVSGAFIAGGDVASTISKGIINIDSSMDTPLFVTAMFSALFAAAIWLNLATWLKAPVSTTHSIVGGVAGAGVTAMSFTVVNWTKMSSIAISWVVSPILSGIIASIFYYALRHLILKRENKIIAARTWVPIYMGVMSSGFVMYLMVKGLKKIATFDSTATVVVGVLVFGLSAFIMRIYVSQASKNMENKAVNVSYLFQWPLIISAALLSFAHGANDVANAIGPLSAIVSVLDGGTVGAKVGIPFWVMSIGAMGIALGLLLFGPKLIREVGENITRLDRVRASCVALSAAVTVLCASWLGLPVSSTHIAIGGIFGIGLYREWVDYRQRRAKCEKEDAKHLRKRKLVRRSALYKIASAWIFTVPAAAVLSGVIFLILQSIGFADLF